MHVQAWQSAQAAWLRHIQLQATPAQQEMIEKAVSLVLPRVGKASGDNPNARGVAIYTICMEFLEAQRVADDYAQTPLSSLPTPLGFSPR